MADRHMRLRNPEFHRQTHALTLYSHHTDRELFFLELAIHAPDDESSRWLEAYADDAYHDALAIANEHDLQW